MCSFETDAFSHRLSFLSTVFCLLVLSVSCSRDGIRGGEGDDARTALSFAVADAGGGLEACPGVASWIFEVDGNWDGQARTRRYLLDADGARTCISQGLLSVCGEQGVEMPDELPTRVRVLGLSGTPQALKNGDAFDVVCRGETLRRFEEWRTISCAQDAEGCAQAERGVTLQEAGESGPLGKVYEATVRMLRIGASNRLFAPAGADVPWRAHGTLTAMPDGTLWWIGGAVGDGAATASIDVFDPTWIGFAERRTLPEGRAAHGATLVTLPGGEQKLWLAGGVSAYGGTLEDAQPALTSTLWLDAKTAAATPGANLFEGVAGAAAESYDAIVDEEKRAFPYLLGGYLTQSLSAHGGGAGVSTLAQVVDSADPDKLFAKVSDVAGRGGAAVVRVNEAESVVTGGFSQTAPAAACQRSQTSSLTNCRAKYSLGNFVEVMSLAEPHAHHTGTGIRLEGGLALRGALFTGGVNGWTDVLGEFSGTRVYVDANGSYDADFSLPEARARHTGTWMPDGSILLAGGGLRGADGRMSLVQQSTVLWTPGDFDPAEGRFGALACGGPGQVACPDLLSPRVGHAAAGIAGSGTWLDGSVLLVGGATEEQVAADAGGPVVGVHPAAELFVPAYVCDEHGEPGPDAQGGILPRCDVNRRLAVGDGYFMGEPPPRETAQ